MIKKGARVIYFKLSKILKIILNIIFNLLSILSSNTFDSSFTTLLDPVRFDHKGPKIEENSGNNKAWSYTQENT